MNFRLFIIMGLTWTVDNISAYVEGFENAPKWTETLFYITDNINDMQGIFIFILLICKRNIYLALVERIKSLRFFKKK